MLLINGGIFDVIGGISDILFKVIEMNIVVLASNQCVVSAVYGLVDVFYAAKYCQQQHYAEQGDGGISCKIVTVDNQDVKGYNGISISPTAEISAIGIPDVIIVSSSVRAVIECCADDVLVDNLPKVKQWLTTCHQQGSVIASYCTGSFLLASCGLLNGKVATTHWRSADLFRRIFPSIRLDCDQMLIDNQDVICSGGSMSYIDLALYIVDKYIDKNIASECAKLMVFDPVRQKQSPYVTFQAQKSHDDQPILKAQEWIESHFSREILIDELADLVGLGARTFKRRFKQATQETPLTYLQRIRVEHVKTRLENTTEPINQIIWSIGYEDISSFRQLFKRFTGVTPKDYRQKYL